LQTEPRLPVTCLRRGAWENRLYVCDCDSHDPEAHQPSQSNQLFP